MSKEDAAIIQAVAQAINDAGQGYLRDCADQYAGWADIPESVFAKAAIAAYLGALEAAGWAVVPKRLTKEMEEAGADNNHGGRYTFVPAYEAALVVCPKPPGAE